MLERDDWLDALRSPGSETRDRLGRRSAGEASAGAAAGEHRARGSRGPGPKQPAGQRHWPGSHGCWGSVAPGREKILTSPLVIGLVVSLRHPGRAGLLAQVDHRLDDRQPHVSTGPCRTSMTATIAPPCAISTAFLTANPKDSRAGKAQVLRSFANVRQYVTAEGGTWSSALEAANEMVDQVGALPEFRDEQVNLAELIIKIGEGLADRRTQAADAKALAEAETVVGLHARVAGEPAPAFLNSLELPAKLDEARAAVTKAAGPREALASMDQAIKDCAPSRVYDARDALVEQYADLAQDKDLVTRMTAANELIRKAVTVDQTRRPAERATVPSALGPPTSLVLRSTRETRSPIRRRRDRLCAGRRLCLRDPRLDRRAALAPAAGPGGAVRATARSGRCNRRRDRRPA